MVTNEGQLNWALAAPGKFFWPLWTGAKNFTPIFPICPHRWWMEEGDLTPGLMCIQNTQNDTGNSEMPLTPEKICLPFGKSTSQRIYPKQHTPKIG